MKNIALSINGTPILAPSGVPTGGLSEKGGEIIPVAITLLLIFVIVLALVFLIFSAIQWITSGGDKQGLQNARNRLIYSLVGLIIALLAFLIINLIGEFFNIRLI